MRLFSQAFLTLIKKRTAAAVLGVLASMMTATGVQAADYFNGFEVDTANWFALTRVASGTDGITSASGGFHAVSDPDPVPFTRWGGYNDDPACAGGGTCLGTFPTGGYDTSIDIYLNVGGGYANDTRFDFDSAVFKPDGNHRRDFIFNCGFYNDDTDSGANGTPGAGVNRFICSASNNSQPGSAFAKNPGRTPTVVATTSGWYTFRHQFRDDGSGVLTVDLSVLNDVGTVIQTWTLSDATDLIGTTVGGNGYGWMDYNQLGRLALDNAQRTSIVLAPLASCNDPDVVGNGGDLTEGASNGTAQALGWDVGSGQCNGSFTVTLDNAFPSAGIGTESGIELGIRAIKRFTGSYVRSGTANDSYEVDLGYRDGIPANGSIWGFQHSIAYDGSINNLDSLNFIIQTDKGTSVPINAGFGNGIYPMNLFRFGLDDRNGSPANSTPEWNDLYQTSQAPAFNTFWWLSNSALTGPYDVNEEGAWTFRIIAEEAGDIATVEICIHTADADCDSDQDGVDNEADLCRATAADDPARRLGKNRWIWNGNVWETNSNGGGPNKSFTMEETQGCSCEQILDTLVEKTGRPFDGHYKFGCSSSVVEDWIAGLYYMETVDVPAADTDGVDSLMTLKSTENYHLIASGVADALNAAGSHILFDAKYSVTTQVGENPLEPTDWTDTVTLYEGLGTDLLDLHVDGANIDWGAFNLAHVYWHDKPGTGAPVTLWIKDAYYPNNAGFLSVDIFVKLW